MVYLVEINSPVCMTAVKIAVCGTH
jgi:hypothetical protein